MRQDLIELARDGSAAHRLARRVNALVLLDQGMSCEAIARVLLLDDDTVRAWHCRYEEDGIEGLASFGDEGSACRLSDEQQDKLKAWITATLPRTTREVGAWIEIEWGACKVVGWSRQAANYVISSLPFHGRGTHSITPAPHNFACSRCVQGLSRVG